FGHPEARATWTAHWQGAVLRVDSPGSTVRGLRIINSRETGIIINTANVELDGVEVSGSKIGLLLSSAASDCTILTSVFERNETGLMVEAGAPQISIVSSIFRGNTRAGFWFVAATGDASARERARIADSVFDGNASGVVIANQPTFVQRSRFIGN